MHHRAAVLRDLALGDVHAAHDLQAGEDGGLQIGGHGQHPAQKPVHAHTHHELALLRLQMNVARALVHGALDEGGYKADGGRGVRAGVGALHQLRGDDVAGVIPRLALHLLHRADGALAAVERDDGLRDRLARGDHGNDLLMADGLHFFLRNKVERVAHGDEQLVAHELDRHDGIFLCHGARDVFCQLHGDGHGREVDKVHAQLHLQSADELPLGDGAVFDEHVAQALTGLLL